MKQRSGLVALVSVLVLGACSSGSQGVTPTSEVVGASTSVGSEPQEPSATSPDSTAIPDVSPPSPTPTTAVFREPLTELRIDVEPIASGFRQPILATARPGDGRLIVADQSGIVFGLDLFASGFRETIIDISDQVRFGGEQGLLGVAFDPVDPDRMFLHYTGLDGSTVVAEYLLGPTGVADPFSEKVILTHEQPAPNHNGGMIEFGPEGYLYIALGDGGGADDQYDNGQDPHTWLGSILRIDVHRGDPYSIPPDNPFADGVEGAPEVWAWGLRNPWRFSFDRFDLWVGDVGQNQWEEIDLLDARRPGDNGGWPLLEGTHCFRADPCDLPGLVAPLVDYEHRGGLCSVTGGVVYRGGEVPELDGAYLYGDYCLGEVWAMRTGETLEVVRLTDRDGVALRRMPGLTSFGTGPRGEVYLLQEAGTIWQLVATE